jgi:DNA-binding NarL/FixJ family response regulator
MKINVFIADDHAVMRDGLQALLEGSGEVLVVGQAADGRSAVELVKETHPDVVLLDLSMPGLNGIDAARQINEYDPLIRIIILSMMGTSEHVYRALQAGVYSYLLKESAGREVLEAVIEVSMGNKYFSQGVMDMLVGDYLENRRSESKDSPLESLSAREQEVMQLVLEGKTSAEIGEALHLSPKTVDSYRSRLMQKLGVSDLVSLIKFAFVHGLIPVK